MKNLTPDLIVQLDLLTGFECVSHDGLAKTHNIGAGGFILPLMWQFFRVRTYV